MKSFKIYKQYDKRDCGPACLRMIAKYYGKHYSMQTLRRKVGVDKGGSTLLGISDAAEALGFRTVGAKLTWDQLNKSAPLPCILYWDKYHFVVVFKVTSKKIYIADPSKGKIVHRVDDFLKHWIAHEGSEQQGICLLLYPTPRLISEEDEKKQSLNFGILFNYLVPYKRLLFQLVLGLFAGAILQLIFPFLTQAVVDIGISNQDINFIYLILIAQVMLFLGRVSVEFIRSWILLHISTRINISILSDFLIRLMKLPMSFFDTKKTGDIMQRMEDHTRIQNFLTGQTLSILFAVFNLLVFSLILFYYNLQIFIVFTVCTLFYLIWIVLFLKKRRALDHSRFRISSNNQSKIIQLIQGMQEIKLNTCEKQKRWEWERLQAKLFHYRVKNLALEQYQQAGALFINEGKNIFVTFLSAIAVINGGLTLGGMMAIQYIVGQLNGPVNNLIDFVQSTQDAQISLERLNEVHNTLDEEWVESGQVALNFSGNIKISGMSFKYPGAENDLALINIDLELLENKITAIVGTSGSGKTTLIKLLLKFYPAASGRIHIGNTDFQSIDPREWRRQCGVVLQDGFIFSDTIANNIAVSDTLPDIMKLRDASRVANILEFVESLPLGFETLIGREGNGISQGQRQRILIARAVYKNPKILFFDEATNALDTRNEKKIMENLSDFFVDRTVVVVAHRLSTVKNADNIIVLEKGEVVEQGNHSNLLSLEGTYFNLVKDQIDLQS